MSAIESTGRSTFFPNAKGAANDNVAKAKKSSMLKERNNSERKNQLESFAKRDTKIDIPVGVKDFSRIKKAVDKAPEIDNSDKVAKLKAQIQSGQYKVNYDAIADKLLSQGM